MKKNFDIFTKIFLTAIVALVFQCATQADDELEVAGDRPDFTESVATVGLNRVQLESGYTFSNTTDIKTQNFPEVLLRYGVTDDIELRVVSGDVVNINAGGTKTWERNDAGLGFKYAMFKSPNNPWRFSLLGSISAPTGTTNASTKGYDPELKLAWKRAIAEEMEISGNINWRAQSDPLNDTHYNVFGASISLGMELVERTGVFFEIFTIDKGAGYGGRGDTANGGVVYKILPNFLVDARVGVTQYQTENEMFAGSGIVYQFGRK